MITRILNFRTTRSISTLGDESKVTRGPCHPNIPALEKYGSGPTKAGLSVDDYSESGEHKPLVPIQLLQLKTEVLRQRFASFVLQCFDECKRTMFLSRFSVDHLEAKTAPAAINMP